MDFPEKIVAGTEEVSYVYSATGQKLATKVGDSYTYYRGSFVYNDGELDHMIHPEGIIRKASGGYVYYYAQKDHLGSTRILAYEADGKMKAAQTMDYYPFGLSFQSNGTNYNRYLFSGKELQDQDVNGKALQLYDFGARNYDPVLGRWFNIDPALQFTNPYVYCLNNPMNRRDPDGKWDDWVYNKQTEQYRWNANVTQPGQTPLGYEYVGRSMSDVDAHFRANNPIGSMFSNPTIGNTAAWPGEVTSPGFVCSLEMWLDASSQNFGEVVVRIGANVGYGMINSPYSLLTGRTIGGRPLNSNEKVEAFIDVVPGFLFFGLGKVGGVAIDAGRGLQGYNQFLSGSRKSGTVYRGLNWQQDAGNAFRINNINRGGLVDSKEARGVTGVVSTTHKEAKKEKKKKKED